MEIEAWTTLLMAIAPSVCAIVTVVCGFLALIKSIKSIHKDNADTVIQSQEKLKSLEKKVNIINSKLTSIEKALLDEENRR